jgi:L-2-hydroxyglutarate oxidase LhgO
METLDVAVIGAGVIGLAIGRSFALTGRNVTVIEAEKDFGTGISSRNSEVIHAGIYYPGGSLKARFCVQGKKLLYDYCHERQVACRKIGKIIVANNEREKKTLKGYLEQGKKNGVDDLQLLGRRKLLEMEPALSALTGLYSPSTGIINSHQLMQNLLTDIHLNGGTVVFDNKLTGGRLESAGPVIELNNENIYPLRCKLLINAAGLGAQAVARSLGQHENTIPAQYYAKGHYYSLNRKSPFAHLVYPVANNAGLGIHASLDLQGRTRFGPDVKWVDEADYSFDEDRRSLFAVSIKRYYADLDESLLIPDYTGIRPKIVKQGEPAADFLIQSEKEHGQKGLINLFGIESPGLTSSVALGDHVANHFA